MAPPFPPAPASAASSSSQSSSGALLRPRRSSRHFRFRYRVGRRLRPPVGTVRLHLLCIFFALGSFVWGYNVGVLASVLANPGFAAALPGLDAAGKGLITAIYYLGTWLSYVFISHPAADLLGRRYAALAGTLVTAVGVALEAAAGLRNGDGVLLTNGFAMMVAGRIVEGLGIAIISTSVPLYQAEVAPAKQRGRYVVMNHIGFTAGLAVGFWVGYAVTFWDDSHGVYVGWRVALALQYIPSFIFAVGLPFLPETPRWLVTRNRIERARAALLWLREDAFSSEQVELELDVIRRSVDEYRDSKMHWHSLLTDESLFRRLWRAGLLQFMAQMCGATAMKYYLPTLFKVLGLGTRLSLMAGGIESTLKIGCTVVEAIIIDVFGRRATLIVGCFVMAFSMLINGALPLAYPNNSNRAADYACIVFIFIYSLGYSMGFGPSAWVYGSEIFPTAVRARGLNIAASCGAIGSIVVAQVWPVGIDRIGPRIYFFFVAINLACAPVIYLFYPETKGRALEDMDALFGKASMARRPDSDDESTSVNGPLPTKNIRQPRQSREVGGSVRMG